MTENRTYVYAEKRVAERRIALYLVHRGLDGTTQEGTIQWNPCDPLASPMRYAERLDETAAQVLMDQLWEAGVRPTDAAGSAGAMAAVQANLADLRQMVTFLQTTASHSRNPLESMTAHFASLQKFNETLVRHLTMAATQTVFHKETIAE